MTRDDLLTIVEGPRCQCGGKIGFFTSDLDICDECQEVYSPRNEPDWKREAKKIARALLAVLKVCDSHKSGFYEAHVAEEIIDIITNTGEGK